MNHPKPSEVHALLKRRLLVDGYPLVYDIEKSHGSYLHDAISGQDYLDLFSFFASMPIGFNHENLNKPDVREHLATVAAAKPSNSDIYTAEMATFVDTFDRVANPDGFPHLFFVSGGSLAVENALKAAFDWKAQKRIAKGVNTADDQIDLEVIHFEKAFHGRSGYTLSLTNTNDPRKYKHFPKFDWPRVPHPTLRFPIESYRTEIEQREKESLDAIRQAIDQRGDRIAALIIEPIQGEGGDNQVRDSYLQELRRLADEHEFLLIYDEVQTGMGLTGAMWYYQHSKVQPDIIAFGKKSQVCGMMASRRLEEVDQHVFAESSRINSTWGGNLVDMVRSTLFLNIIEHENLVSHAQSLGGWLLDELHTLAQDYPSLIANTRGKGLMLAFDLPNKQQRDHFIDGLFERKTLALPCGEASVRLRPHLNITQETAHEAMKRLRETCQTMKG